MILGREPGSTHQRLEPVVPRCSLGHESVANGRRELFGLGRGRVEHSVFGHGSVELLLTPVHDPLKAQVLVAVEIVDEVFDMTFGGRSATVVPGRGCSVTRVARYGR